MKQYIVYGNGGYSKVIRDIIEIRGGIIVAVYDENHPYNPDAFPSAEVVIAIGNNEIRQKIAKDISHSFATLIHPKAVVASRALIGEGSVILANAVVQEQATIGEHCIIQPNVIIDHDAKVGDFSIIYPNSYVGGEAQVPSLTTVPPNTIVERKKVFA